MIYDSEAASIMETIDLVLVGAEAVVKNGGIINKVGTLSLAICAKEMNKPMYVFAESFKFSLLYPLNQSDIPSEFRVRFIEYFLIRLFFYFDSYFPFSSKTMTRGRYAWTTLLPNTLHF